MQAAGVYIHIPFCRAKCPYCDFYSRASGEDQMLAYADAVKREIARAAALKKRRVDTVYFGGGTPTALPSALLEEMLCAVFHGFEVAGDAEITVEANPETVNADMLKALCDAGFNRMSIGVQSGADAELAALGRRHTAAQAARAVTLARQAGFANISADIMLGVPGQTAESLDGTLSFLTGLPLSHVSAYILKIEQNTVFGKKGYADPDDDLAADLYLQTADALARAGFMQYEISNFAKRGRESRHNLKYWRCEEYFGFGAAAHGFLEGKRYCHGRSVDRYIATGGAGDLTVTDPAAGDFYEYAMLRLRLCAGLDLDQAAARFGGAADKAALLKRAKPLANAGLLTTESGRISLTRRGFLLSNAVIGRLLDG